MRNSLPKICLDQWEENNDRLSSTAIFQPSFCLLDVSGTNLSNSNDFSRSTMIVVLWMASRSSQLLSSIAIAKRILLEQQQIGRNQVNGWRRMASVCSLYRMNNDDNWPIVLEWHLSLSHKQMLLVFDLTQRLKRKQTLTSIWWRALRLVIHGIE